MRRADVVAPSYKRQAGFCELLSAGIEVVRRRSRAAIAKLADRDTKLLRLIGEIRRDARAREYDDADREDVEDPVVALERRGSGVTVPVRLEDDLRDLPVVSPAGG